MKDYLMWKYHKDGTREPSWFYEIIRHLYGRYLNL